MSKALMLASVASMIGQFNMNNIDILQKMGMEVHVIANFESNSTMTTKQTESLKNKLRELDVIVYEVNLQRQPFSVNNFKAYRRIKEIITKECFDLIHLHSPIGGVLGRLAAIEARKKGTKVIYTAHGFHFFKAASIINWLTYYPIEKTLSRYTDTLITMNNEDYMNAKKMNSKTINKIHGIGVDLDKFSTKKMETKREKMGLKKDDLVILSVGELSKRKNHEVIIKALKEIDNPKIKYYICGMGELESYLKKLIKDMNLEKQVFLLGFRNDISEWMNIADIFAFPSYQEGLPVSVMEAMAIKLPVVCSKIRGNVDLIENDKGGMTVEVNNVEGYKNAIEKLAKNERLRGQFGEYNHQKVQRYSVKNVNDEMTEIYSYSLDIK